MKIVDEFTTMFGDRATIHSKDIKFNKKLLDLQNLDGDAEMIRIPLNLKIDDLGEDGENDFVVHTNEMEYDADDNWVDDCDREKSFLELMVNPFHLVDETKDDFLQVTINIIPPYRSQDEIDSEVAAEKASEGKSPMPDGYIVFKADEHNPTLYYWELLRDKLQNEKNWLDENGTKEGHYRIYWVQASHEEMEEIRKTLLSIPEIRQVVPVGDGVTV